MGECLAHAGEQSKPGTAWEVSAVFAIFSTMAGAIEIARILPMPAMREKVLTSAMDFLLRSF
jgi:TetR/AcrR family transcriptional repressor of nem operon